MKKAGTYEMKDSAEIKCSTSKDGCPGVIRFKSGEYSKFCSVCGREKSKLRHGYSAYDYASVMAEYVREHLVDMGDEFYFMQNNRSNGPGHTVLNVHRYYNMKVSGFIDASKVSIKFTHDNASLDVHVREDGPWSTTARMSTMDMTSVEINERWLYENTPDELRRKILSELKGLWQEPIDREKYNSIRKEIGAQNLTELARYNADDRVPRVGWSIPMKTLVLRDFSPEAIVKALKRYSNKQATIGEIKMFMQMKTASEYPLVKMEGYADLGHARFSMAVEDKDGNMMGDAIVKYLPVPGDANQVFVTGFDFYVK